MNWQKKEEKIHIYFIWLTIWKNEGAIGFLAKKQKRIQQKYWNAFWH